MQSCESEVVKNINLARTNELFALTPTILDYPLGIFIGQSGTSAGTTPTYCAPHIANGGKIFYLGAPTKYELKSLLAYTGQVELINASPDNFMASLSMIDPKAGSLLVVSNINLLINLDERGRSFVDWLLQKQCTALLNAQSLDEVAGSFYLKEKYCGFVAQAASPRPGDINILHDSGFSYDELAQAFISPSLEKGAVFRIAGSAFGSEVRNINVYSC